MFINVTRHGGLRPLRLATAAIATIDAVTDGSAIRLIGGDSLRVSETPAEIEERCAPQLLAATACLGVFAAREMVAGDIMPVDGEPKPRGRRR